MSAQAEEPFAHPVFGHPDLPMQTQRALVSDSHLRGCPSAPQDLLVRCCSVPGADLQPVPLPQPLGPCCECVRALSSVMQVALPSFMSLLQFCWETTCRHLAKTAGLEPKEVLEVTQDQKELLPMLFPPQICESPPSSSQPPLVHPQEPRGSSHLCFCMMHSGKITALGHGGDGAEMDTTVGGSSLWCYSGCSGVVTAP